VKHFSDELWADFVRNLAPSTTARAMQKHIEDGCSKCEAALKVGRTCSGLLKRKAALALPRTRFG